MVYVLRLGHRLTRDKRVTSHLALVARAFGANGFILEGKCDPSVERTIEKTNRCWGRALDYYECGVSGKSLVREWRANGGEVIHLTMYGLPIWEVIDDIRSSPRPKLIIVGAEKVDRYYYDNADYNVSVGLQPHSEIAALAVFLDRLFQGSWSTLETIDPAMYIIPQRRGKNVVRLKEDC